MCHSCESRNLNRHFAIHKPNHLGFSSSSAWPFDLTKLLHSRYNTGATMTQSISQALETLNQSVIDCRLCPRLVEHRERMASEKRARYRDQEYWGRPLPSLGDPEARALIIGLAPAAHGGNRTGPYVHRRQQRELALRDPPQVRLRQLADLHAPGRRPYPQGRLRHGGGAMRPASQQAIYGGEDRLPPLPAGGVVAVDGG